MNTILIFLHNGAKTQSITFVVSFLSLFSFSQVKDTSVNKLDEVLVSAIRVTKKRRSALAI
jgi:hypothetical protein